MSAAKEVVSNDDDSKPDDDDSKPDESKPDVEIPESAQACNELESPYQKLLNAYEASLPRWLSRLGLRGVQIEDAKQEVLFELWQHRHEISHDETEARKELTRIAATVARRHKRQNERHPLCEEADLPDPRNIEAKIAARALWVEAAKGIDEKSRKLIIARQLECRSFVEIAKELGEKPDTIRMRVEVANKKLQKELRRLLGKPKKRNGSSSESAAIIFALTPLDRAVLRTMLEAEEQVPQSTLVSKRRTIASKGSFFSGMPMSVLVGALVMLPAETPNASPPQAEKCFNAPLPAVVVTVEAPVPTVPIPPPPQPIEVPPERQARHAAPLPTVDKATIAALRRLGGQSVR